MKKLSADGSTPLNLKMAPALRGNVSRVAKHAGQSESATIRAALRLALPLLEADTELVKRLDAGMGDEGMKSLLARAQSLADSTGASVVLVLRAALRMSLMSFAKLIEQGQINEAWLRFVDMGGFEMPSLQGVFDTMMKAPAMEKVAEAATVLNPLDEKALEREAKALGITEEALAGSGKAVKKKRAKSKAPVSPAPKPPKHKA